MARILEQAEKIAVHDGPVLIEGETGTGKEVVARIIHGLSNRNGPLVSVNCGAIPEDLIENELFGHAAGAYTGAERDSEGLVGRAKHGSLFLDEIGELPLMQQVKLLRFLQEGTYERLGSSKQIEADSRIICATNRNLLHELEKKAFRADLYFRISTFSVRLPPLRERKEDIPLLIDHFLWIAKNEMNRPALKISEEVLEILTAYDWPGNVREVENLIMRLTALCETDTIQKPDLPEGFGLDSFEAGKRRLRMLKEQTEHLERDLILQALIKTGGNKNSAARLTGIPRSTLIQRMKEYEIDSETVTRTEPVSFSF